MESDVQRAQRELRKGFQFRMKYVRRSSSCPIFPVDLEYFACDGVLLTSLYNEEEDVTLSLIRLHWK